MFPLRRLATLAVAALAIMIWIPGHPQPTGRPGATSPAWVGTPLDSPAPGTP
jgi:hypothetical protein